VLGDNIFFGYGFSKTLQNAKKNVLEGKSTIFSYYVNDPERYGVAEFDDLGNVTSISEKPKNPASNYAVVGLYFYTNDVVKIAKKVRPSHRGELEITSINQSYLKRQCLKVEVLGRGFTWLDTGTHDSLMEAGQFIETIEKRQGLKVACLEEIAYKMEYIDAKKLKILAEPLSKNTYGQYLLNLIK
jgi:glucose-1-phosphate thymidylyltransferase